jgi:hypothetical protein
MQTIRLSGLRVLFSLALLATLVSLNGSVRTIQAAPAGGTDAPSTPLKQGQTVQATANAVGPVRAASKPIGPNVLTDQTLYDSFTITTNYTTTTGSPRTFMGTGYNNAPTGGPIEITKVTVYLASGSAVDQTFSNGVRVNFNFWEDYNPAVTPVFSNSVGNFSADVPALTSIVASTFYPIDITLNPPVVFANDTNNGFAVNYQGNNGAGFASADGLTSLVSINGTAPVIGSSPLTPPNYFWYRNASGRTDFNFASTDSRSFGGSTNNFLSVIIFGNIYPASTATPTNTVAPPTATPTSTNTPPPTNTPGGPTSTATTTATNTLTSTPSAGRPDTIGIYNGGSWFLRNSNSAGAANINVVFGNQTDLPVVGDWNADGMDSIGLYRVNEARFILSNSNMTPVTDFNFVFGNPGDEPIAGRWDNTVSNSGVGVYRDTNGILYLRKTLSGSAVSDYFMIFGNPGDIGLAGDWDGNGFDSVGVYRDSNSTWYLSNLNGAGITYADFAFVWTVSENDPIVGDWDGNMTTTVGYRTLTGNFVLHALNQVTAVDNVFAFGPQGPTAYPVAGKWTMPLSGAQPYAGGVVISADNGAVNSNPEGAE